MKTKISTKVLSFMMALILMLGNIPAFEVKAADSSVSGDVLTYYFNGEERQQTFSDSFLGSCYFYVDDYYETTVAIVTSENNINSCTKLASADTIIFADSFAEEVDGIITAWHFTATNNSGLKELYLPNGITIIGSSLCASKYNLKKVELGNAVTEIQASAFSGCSSLYDINIPDSVVSIGNSAFYNTSLTSINMPSSLQTIGNQAFQSCDTFNWNFTENCLPNVTSIGTSAFEGTDVAGEISRITLPSLTTIGAKAFKATKVSKLVVSPEITSIGDDAFTECNALDLALIENGVQNVTTPGSASAPKWFGSTYAAVKKTVVSGSYGSKWPTGTINRLNVVYPGRLKITILGDSPYIVTPEETVELGLTSIKLAKTHYTKTDDSGNPIISSYQWYESDTMPTGDISSASGTEISGATTDKLTVSLDTAGTKYYFCKVTVDNGDKFDAYDNYSAVFTFTVEQGEQVVDIQAPNKEFDNSAYNESNIVVTSTTSNTPVITWYDSSKQELTEAPAAVGTYFIKVAIAGNESYLDYESDYIQVEINKGKLNPTVTAETSDYTNEPYDADSLVKVENINSLYTGDYELVYFSTNDNTSTPIACPTAPGAYYVSAKFAGDDSFEALTTEPVEFVINKDKPTFSISEKSQVYDGTEFSMTASVSKSAFKGSPAPASQDLTFNYYEKNGNDYDRLPYVPVDAGTYYVEAIYAGDAHYGEAKSEMVKIIIEPTVPVISIKDDVTTVTYDGNEVKPDYTATGISESDKPTGDVTYEYYTDAECKSKATAPKNAGTYYVKAVIAAKGNYKKAVSEPAKLVIEKADITATMTISGITYNGKPLPANNVTFSFNLPSANAQKLSSADAVYTYTINEATEDGLPTNAGTYEISAKFEESDNYNEFSVSPASVTIQKEDVTIVTDDIEVTYINKPIEISVAATGANSNNDYLDFVEYYFYKDAGQTQPTSTEDGALTTGGSPSKLGTYYALVTCLEGENHLEAEELITVNVIPPRYKVTFEDNTGVEYTGQAIEIKEAVVKAYDNTDVTTNPIIAYTYYTDEECTVKTSTADGAASEGEAPVKVGTYYVHVTVESDGIHEAKTDITDETVAVLEIIKPYYKITSSDKSVVYDGTVKSLDVEVDTKISGETAAEPTITYYTDEAMTSKTTAEDGAASNGSAPSNAGTYYVEIICTESEVNSAVTNTDYKLEIKKAEITKFTLSEVKFAYTGQTGEEPVITIKGVQNGVAPDVTKIDIIYYSDEACTKLISKPVNVGTYYVQALCNSERNYTNAKSEIAAYVIEKKAYDAESAQAELAEVAGGTNIINNVFDKMEYKKASDNEWISVPQDITKLTKLTGAVYEVRMKGDENTNPSEAVTIIVNNANPNAEVIKSGAAIEGINKDFEILIEGKWYSVTELPMPSSFDEAKGIIYKLPFGSYEVRVKGTEDTLPSESITVDVVQADAPVLDNDGKSYITGITSDMEIKVLPDGEWIKVIEIKAPLTYDANTQTVKGLKLGSYSFRHGETDKAYPSKEAVITVNFSEAPNGISVEAGCIVGTTDEMEYALYTGDLNADEAYMGDDASLIWNTCQNRETETGDGVFVVRYKSISSHGLSFTRLVKVGFRVEAIADYVYTGSAIKPVPVVYDGDDLLTEGVHYTIAYKNNKNAYTYNSGDAGFDASKAPSIVINGKGNYQSKLTVAFKIQPKNLSDEDILVTDASAIVNGKIQYKIPQIKFGKAKLKNNTDFICNYEDKAEGAYIEAGNYSITVSGKGNYTGTITAYQSMADKAHLISKAKIAKIPEQKYMEGKAVELSEADLVVRIGSTTLKRDTDYTVAYMDNTASGKATVIIRGINEYKGTKTAQFVITGTDISKVNFNGLEDKVYTGEPVLQDKLSLNHNGVMLKENKDYTIIYDKNISTGTARLTVNGMGAYSGKVTKNFKIKPYDISKDADALKLSQLKPVAKYQKGGATISLDINIAGMTLIEGVDYQISYANNKKVAVSGSSKSPVATINGIGNYTGFIKIPFSITEKALDDIDYPVNINIPDMPENKGKGKCISKPVLTDADGKVLKLNTDYSVKYYKAEEDGTYTELTQKSSIDGSALVKAEISGKGNYTGTIEVFYRVYGKAFSKASIKADKQQYTGSNIYLDAKDLTVTYGSGKNKIILEYGRDYEIVEGSYVNNLKTGTAKVTLKGIGEYSGQKTVKFKIYKRWFK